MAAGKTPLNKVWYITLVMDGDSVSSREAYTPPGGKLLKKVYYKNISVE
jgi:hypothetical protein